MPPFVVHGTHFITGRDLEDKKNYHQILKKLTDDKIEIEKANSLKYLNDYLQIRNNMGEGGFFLPGIYLFSRCGYFCTACQEIGFGLCISAS